jgi:hypothetical protein
LEQESDRTRKSLGRLHGIFRHANWSNLQYHLRHRYPQIYKQFSRFDEDGYERVGKAPFDDWLPPNISGGTVTRNGEMRPAATLIKQVLKKAAVNVHSLSQQEKQMLMDSWCQQIHDDALDDLYESVKTTDSAHKQLTDIHDEVDRRVLQAADVIGITTTGLAKRISTLQRVQCKIVICEEAGEVMEPHMISASLPTVNCS